MEEELKSAVKAFFEKHEAGGTTEEPKIGWSGTIIVSVWV